MSDILKMLLELGISPAGAAVVALIVTWFFVIFYFLPKLQAGDEQQRELNKHVEELTEQLGSVQDQLDDNVNRVRDTLETCSELLDDLKSRFELTNENIDMFVNSISRLRKAINNLMFVMMQKEGDGKDSGTIELALKLLNDIDELEPKKNFRVKNLER